MKLTFRSSRNVWTRDSVAITERTDSVLRLMTHIFEAAAFSDESGFKSFGTAFLEGFLVVVAAV